MDAPRAAPKPVILVVDDELGMRDMLTCCLGDSGFDIKAVRDGEGAMAVLRAEHVDLVLTDVTMPFMNGFELLTAMEERKSKPPVIVISGFGTVEMTVYAMRHGASDFLLKPFDIPTLVGRIREVIGDIAKVTAEIAPAC